MSASASKKRRQQRNEAGLTPSELSASQKKAEQKKKRLPIIIFCVVTLVAVALVVGLALLADKQAEARLDAQIVPTYDITTVAATVGEEQITVPMYNYFYTMTVNNNASLYTYFGLQAGTPFAEQSYGEDQTFEDVFKEQTKSTIQQYVNIYAEAKANGFALSEDDLAAIEENIASARTTAKNSGYRKLNHFLYVNYGEGCNEENFREYLTLMQTVSSYAAKMEETFVPSDEDIENEYAENPDAYDLIHYTLYTVKAESIEEEVEAEGDDEEPQTQTVYTDEAKAEAKAEAEAAAESFPTEGTTESYGNKSTLVSRFDEDTAAWLVDSARQAGDVEVFEVDGGQSYRVIRYESRDTNDYNRVNAYVVSIPLASSSSETNEDGSAVETSNEGVIAKITAGLRKDMTDEAFEKLISDNGYTASSSEIAKTSYNEDVINFLYGSDRTAGDFQVITTESYYYVVRFQSVAEKLYRLELVEESLHETAENDWYTAVNEKNTIEIDEYALAYANTNRTLYSSGS